MYATWLCWHAHARVYLVQILATYLVQYFCNAPLRMFSRLPAHCLHHTMSALPFTLHLTPHPFPSCDVGGEPHDALLWLAGQPHATLNTEKQYPYVSGETGKLTKCSPKLDGVATGEAHDPSLFELACNHSVNRLVNVPRCHRLCQRQQRQRNSAGHGDDCTLLP